jgi:hypothetical protein
MHGDHSPAGDTQHSADTACSNEEGRMISTLTLAQRARNSHRAPRYSICLIHPFDPRGEKVGGLETYIRDFITFHPADTDLLLIGVDSTGDMRLGKVHRLTSEDARSIFCRSFIIRINRLGKPRAASAHR